MPCSRFRGGWICTGYQVAPPGYHFKWNGDCYPIKTKSKKHFIKCFDCDEPAIVVDYWALQLHLAYCENCAYVHRDIDPKKRMVRV